MERIWAPWRKPYVAKVGSESGCIFCSAANSDCARERLVLSKREHTLTMLNRYPYTGGHLMVAPLRHTAELGDLSDEELLGLMHDIRQARALLQEVVRPDGFNVGFNLGKAAGAGVEDHLHVHIVPRWNGDSNFMAVIGDVRVISEGLTDTYDRLLSVLKSGG